MSRRRLIPALLSGLLAVGCATAQAQDEVVEEPVVREDPVATDAARRNAEHREHLIVAEQELARRRAELDVARRELDERRAALEGSHRDSRTRIAEITAVLADLEAESEARRRRGLGEDHPEMVELREQMERHRLAIVETEEWIVDRRAEMEPLVRELRERETLAQEAAWHYDELVAESGRGRGRRRARDPRATPDAPFRRGGERGVEGRIDRLERAVAELRELFETHGVPADRRARAFAELERRRAGARGPQPGRGRDGLPGRVAGGAGGGPGQPGQPGGGGRHRTGPTPPPDADAVRARVEEARMQLEHARAENEELRRQVEVMHAEVRRMRDVANTLQEALNARIKADAEREQRERGEGEGGGAR